MSPLLPKRDCAPLSLFHKIPLVRTEHLTRPAPAVLSSSGVDSTQLRGVSRRPLSPGLGGPLALWLVAENTLLENYAV